MFTHAGRAFYTVAAARLFADADARGLAPLTGTCNWLVDRTRLIGDEEYGWEFDTRVEDCGAEAVFHDEGWECTAGHEHTVMEVREAQGWDYAGDEYDAAVIERGGRRAVPVGPTVVLDERVVAHLAASI